MIQSSRPLVFLSHIDEEAELATAVRKRVLKDFLSMVDIFQSSDSSGISAGDKWLDRVGENLKLARVMIVLCSPKSVTRPWINFEVGAGWVKDIPVIPICHSGMTRTGLPIPMNLLQAFHADDPSHWTSIYQRLAKEISSDVPQVDFQGLVKDIEEYETASGYRHDVVTHVSAILAAAPSLRVLFDESPTWEGNVRVRESVRDAILPHLKALLDIDLITFEIRNRMANSRARRAGRIKVRRRLMDIIESALSRARRRHHLADLG